MIFNVPGHIQYIRNGLSKRFINSRGVPARIVKTQTRRVHRGKYREGGNYAIQPCRICKGIESYRIVMDRIWEEKGLGISEGICVGDPGDRYISKEDAWVEGGYTPKEFEELFRKLNPTRDWSRWAFEFHVIEVRR